MHLFFQLLLGSFVVGCVNAGGNHSHAAGEIIGCDFTSELQDPAFRFRANCSALPDSTLYFGSCSWDDSPIESSPSTDGVFLDNSAWTFTQTPSSDCGCVVATTMEGNYQMSCAVYVSMGEDSQVQHLATVVSTWATNFATGTYSAVDVELDILETAVAQLSVSMNLYDEDFAIPLDPWYVLTLGALVYVLLEIDIVGSGILYVDRITLCNLADLEAPGLLCADLYLLDETSTSDFDHIATQAVVALNVPFEISGNWYLHALGGLETGQQRRRLLQADTFSTTKALLVQPETGGTSTSSNDSLSSAAIIASVDGISSGEGPSSAGSDVDLIGLIGLSAGAVIMAGVGMYIHHTCVASHSALTTSTQGMEEGEKVIPSLDTIPVSVNN